MPIILSSNHPTLLLKEKIKDATKLFLKNNGFNYFQFLRVFADGSMGLLTNHTGLTEYFQYVKNSPVVFSSFEKGQENVHAYWFLWDEKLPKFPVDLAREKFNFHNGITLVRRSKNYYDMVAVALPQEQQYAASFYFNKLKVIETFAKEFEVDNKDLIHIMDKNPLLLPPRYRDKNYKKICLNAGKIFVKTKLGLTYLTSQELECLRLWCDGKTLKQIGQFFKISPRTVETYLLRIKLRTNHNTRDEMNRLLSGFVTD